MEKDLLDSFNRRLSRLEREARWWRVWGAVAGIIAAAFVIVGQTPTFATSRIVEAEQFLLKDAEGKVRGRLMVGTDNSTSLILYDHTGMARTWLGARRSRDNGLPFLWFNDDDGRTRMTLGYHLDTDPLQGEKYVGPTVRIFDKNGKVSWKAP